MGLSDDAKIAIGCVSIPVGTVALAILFVWAVVAIIKWAVS